MIRSNDIKEILNEIPTGTKMTIREIQNLVRMSYPLSEEDWEIHTNTRPTNYRKWLHRIQGVLAEYKRKGIVKHDLATNSYSF